MPKSAKHKAQRAADFQKTKLKLGSGKSKKVTAKTATDTSFKSRTIALPQQSITADKSQAIVTRRNLTLDDLLTQSRHYNASIRKDSLFGLREILSLHPFLLSRPGVLPAVLSASLRLIPDEDPTVRKAVYTFLSYLLPALQSQHDSDEDKSAGRAAALSHYASSLILYTISALSHIFIEVRIDALRILSLLLDYVPDAVVDGWDGASPAIRPEGVASSDPSAAAGPTGSSRRSAEGSGHQVITCLLTILGIPDIGAFAHQLSVAQNSSGSSSAASLTGTSTATANLPLSARLLLVQTIDKFLDACDSSSSISLADTAPQDLECPTWFMRSAFSSVSDQEAFDHFLRLSSVQGSSDVDQDASGSASRLFASSIRSSAYSREDDSLLDAYSQGRSSAWGVGHLQGSLLRTSEMLPDGDELPDAPCESTGKQPPRTHHSHAIPSRDSVLASALAPIFLNAILDSAPSLFSPDPMQSAAMMTSSEAGLDIHGQMFLAVIKATLKLWRSLAGASTGSSGSEASTRMTSSQLSDLGTFLSKLAPYFPFTEHVPGASQRSSAATEQLVEMELAYAELTALAMSCLNATQDPTLLDKRKGKKKASMKETLLHQLEDVGEYIVETLRNERPSSSLEGSQGGAISAQLSPATFAELLPTIWLLLNLQTQSGAVDKDTDDEDDTMSDDEEPHQDSLGGLPSRLVEAIVTHFGKAGRGKTLIFGFIARLTVLHTYASYSGAFSPLPCPTVLSAIRSWFLNLPRVMWDAAMKKDFRLCSSVAEYLRHVCAADDGAIISHEDMDALHAPLAVFFHIQHQTRGSIAGPYARLPPQEQGRVRALLYFLQPLDPRLRAAAEFADAV